MAWCGEPIEPQNALPLQEMALISNLIVVKAAFDPEAGVWFVEDSDLYGLNAESETLEGLIEKLPDVAADLLLANGVDSESVQEIPIELVAHARTRVRLGKAA
jgi:hypothetical protein